MAHPEQYLERLNDLIAQARIAGADAADAIYVASDSLSVSRRLGAVEHLERSESADVGLRVFVGTRQAIVSSSDITADGLADLPSRAVAMARSVPEDPFCGLAASELLSGEVPDLDMYDTTEVPSDALIAWASEAEEAALAVPGVTNSEGGHAGWSVTAVALAATNGMAQAYRRSQFSLSAAVLAGEGTAMERDYDFSCAVHAEDLAYPGDIGSSAGEKAVKRLHPRRVPTCQVPVIYDPRVSRSLIGHLASAISGSAVARGTTFLKDKMGHRLFPEGIEVIDDPLRRRGLRSKPFDAEGVATQRRKIIDDGTLTTWILDLRSARQLELQTTGHASRGPSSAPSPAPTNLYLAPGKQSPQDLIAAVEKGFYVTEFMGRGINPVTGDYSRGAAGFWIENGQLSYPVSEVTVAGNLNDMFANLSVADDLVFRYGTDAPTVRVDGMTVAGT